MARGGNYNKLPKNLYYINNFGTFTGPYTKRPTLLLKDSLYVNAILLVYQLDTNNNYILV